MSTLATAMFIVFLPSHLVNLVSTIVIAVLCYVFSDTLPKIVARAAPDTYLKIRTEKDILKCTPKHSGGTDINCVYNWIRDNKVKPDVMIILTDGYFGELETDAYLPKYKKKTVLVLSGSISINEDMKRIGKITRLEN